MPANEIDDIFSSKGKRKAVAEAAKPEQVVVVDSKPKKDKKKKKRKADALDEPASAVASSSKTVAKPTKAVAVTVFKESSGAAEEGRPSKRVKTSNKSTEGASKAAPRKSVKEDEERFRDSRGTGPRKKTEEGWNVFKEDELGINAESGGASASLLSGSMLCVNVQQTLPCVRLTATAASNMYLYHRQCTPSLAEHPQAMITR